MAWPPRLVAVLLVSLAACAHVEPLTQKPVYQLPRRSDGKPDLQGVWTNASLTPLERTGAFTSLVVSAEVAGRVQQQQYALGQRAQRPTAPAAGAPADRNSPGGYNRFWVDPGATLGNVKGEYRSSWIVDPPSGRMPLSREGARKRAELRRKAGGASFDGPEQRPMGERCLIGFGGTGGPPMLNVLYNNYYQIIQEPNHLVIAVEMNHDARIIPIVDDKADSTGRRRPSEIGMWLGDSVGWWEGDTLVVETIDFHPSQIGKTPVLVTESGKVTERFTRWSEDQVLYEFTVEDPNVYTQPWKGEMTLNKTQERVFEYACHEGNHALPGILSGARRAEENAASPADQGR